MGLATFWAIFSPTHPVTLLETLARIIHALEVSK
jgi:hypothetical protein